MKLKDAYRQGFIDGMTCFAWWKGDKQEVGTTGTTLGEAVAKVETMWNYSPPPDPVETFVSGNEDDGYPD